MVHKQLLIGLLMMVAALAGCVAEGTQPQENALEEGWGTLAFSTTGEAGEWMLFYQSLPEPVDDLQFEFDVSVIATEESGQPVGLLTSRPALVVDWDSRDGLDYRLSHTFEERGPLFVDREGGSVGYDRSERWGASIGGGTFAGFFFIVGSSAAWSADVEIRVTDQEGGVVGPEFVSTGEGNVFVPEGKQTLSPLDSGPLVGEITLDAVLESPGWTHLQYEYDALQPIGQRSYDITFPNGDQVTGSGSQVGFHVPLLIGSASSSNWRDYLGVVSDVPGELQSTLEYTQAHSRMEAALLHLPMGAEDLPKDFNPIHYSGANWPFQDPSPLTWQNPEEGRSLEFQRLDL